MAVASGFSASASAICCKETRYCQPIMALSWSKKMLFGDAGVSPETCGATPESTGSFRRVASSDSGECAFRGPRGSAAPFFGGGKSLGRSAGVDSPFPEAEEPDSLASTCPARRNGNFSTRASARIALIARKERTFNHGLPLSGRFVAAAGWRGVTGTAEEELLAAGAGLGCREPRFVTGFRLSGAAVLSLLAVEGVFFSEVEVPSPGPAALLLFLTGGDGDPWLEVAGASIAVLDWVPAGPAEFDSKMIFCSSRVWLMRAIASTSAGGRLSTVAFVLSSFRWEAVAVHSGALPAPPEISIVFSSGRIPPVPVSAGFVSLMGTLPLPPETAAEASI